MLRQIGAVFFLVLLALFLSCAHRAVPAPAVERFSVFISGDLEADEFSRLAEVVAVTRKETPCLWLMNGRLKTKVGETVLEEEGAVFTVFARGGVDGVLFEPGAMALNVEETKGLIDRVPFRVLAANVNDTFNIPIAHPWMIRRLKGINIGITGIVLDSNALFLKQKGVRYGSPEYTARKVRMLLKEKADIVALLLPAGDSLKVPGYELVFTSESNGAVRYDINCVGARINEIKTTPVTFLEVEPSGDIAKVIDSLVKVADSVSSLPVVESRVTIPPGVLARAITEGFLKLKEADCFIYDTLAFVREAISPGMITRGMLREVLEEPGRLVFVEVEGAELKPIFARPGIRMVVRSGLPGKRIMARRWYRVAMTPALLRMFPELQKRGVEFSTRSLWEYAVDILQAEGKR